MNKKNLSDIDLILESMDDENQEHDYEIEDFSDEIFNNLGFIRNRINNVLDDKTNEYYTPEMLAKRCLWNLLEIEKLIQNFKLENGKVIERIIETNKDYFED